MHFKTLQNCFGLTNKPKIKESINTNQNLLIINKKYKNNKKRSSNRILNNLKKKSNILNINTNCLRCFVLVLLNLMFIIKATNAFIESNKILMPSFIGWFKQKKFFFYLFAF